MPRNSPPNRHLVEAHRRAASDEVTPGARVRGRYSAQKTFREERPPVRDKGEGETRAPDAE